MLLQDAVHQEEAPPRQLRAVETSARLNSGEIVKLKEEKKGTVQLSQEAGCKHEWRKCGVERRRCQTAQRKRGVQSHTQLASQDSLGWKELGGLRPCKQNCRSGAQALAYHFPEKKSTFPVSFLCPSASAQCPPRCPNPDCPSQKRRRWRTRLWPEEELSPFGIS